MKKLNPIRHEDNRRILTEYISDMYFMRAKVIEVKEDSMELGNHYHRKSDSVFYLLRGNGSYELYHVDDIDRQSGEFKEGECLFVPINWIHTFKLSKGSIMLECASEIYDKEDEIQVTK